MGFPLPLPQASNITVWKSLNCHVSLICLQKEIIGYLLELTHARLKYVR